MNSISAKCEAVAHLHVIAERLVGTSRFFDVQLKDGQYAVKTKAGETLAHLHISGGILAGTHSAPGAVMIDGQYGVFPA